MQRRDSVVLPLHTDKANNLEKIIKRSTEMLSKDDVHVFSLQVLQKHLRYGCYKELRQNRPSKKKNTPGEPENSSSQVYKALE